MTRVRITDGEAALELDGFNPGNDGHLSLISEWIARHPDADVPQEVTDALNA